MKTRAVSGQRRLFQSVIPAALRERFPLLSALCALCLCGWINDGAAQSASAAAKNWVGTWSAAPYRAETNTPPSPGLSNNTLRQIVRVSIGGDTLRVRFSNITHTSAVTINKVNIAVSPDGTKSAVTASTITDLKFNGNANVTMNAGAEVFSDPVAFHLTPSMRLAITTWYGQCATAASMTFHYGSRTNSYLLTGDKTASADFGGATTFERWYNIYAVEVVAPKGSASVAVIGNSITDGYGLTGGLQNRWTDMFSEALLKDPATSRIGVLNLGIGATMLTGTANGAQSGVDRYAHDVLGQAGVRWVIVFYGINDINAGKTATNIIDGFKKIIADTRARDTGIKVYGATITPCNGHSYYSVAKEAVRSSVNAWIRAPGNFAACIDFDKTVRNPSDTTRLQAAYSNDWLHPSAAGYKVMGESINPDLFALPVPASHAPLRKSVASPAFHSRTANNSAILTFDVPCEEFVSLKLYSIAGKEIAELAGKRMSAGTHTVVYAPGNRSSGLYVCRLNTGDRSASHRIVF